MCSKALRSETTELAFGLSNETSLLTHFLLHQIAVVENISTLAKIRSVHRYVYVYTFGQFVQHLMTLSIGFSADLPIRY